MKEITLKLIEKEFQKDITRMKNFKQYKDKEFTIEYIPVMVEMVERDKITKRLGCITRPEMRVIYELENKIIDEEGNK